MTKFVLVNHRTSSGSSTCIEYLLGTGHLRDVSTRPYCDYACRFRCWEKSLRMPWYAVQWRDNGLPPDHSAHIETVISCYRHMQVFERARPSRAAARGAWTAPQNLNGRTPQQSFEHLQSNVAGKCSDVENVVPEIGGY